MVLKARNWQRNRPYLGQVLTFFCQKHRRHEECWFCSELWKHWLIIGNILSLGSALCHEQCSDFGLLVTMDKRARTYWIRNKSLHSIERDSQLMVGHFEEGVHTAMSAYRGLSDSEADFVCCCCFFFPFHVTFISTYILLTHNRT